MKHPVRKLICAVLAAVILLVPAWLGLQAASRAAVREKAAERNANRLKGLNILFDRIMTDETVLLFTYITDAAWDFDMRKYGLRESVDGENYTGPMTYENGFVLKWRDGKAVYPEGWDAEKVPLPQEFPNLESSVFELTSADGNTGMAYFSHLTGDYYAFRIIRGKDLDQYLEDFMDVGPSLGTVEKVYGGHIILFRDGGGSLISKEDDFFPENPTPESMGLDLSGDIEDVRVWMRDGVPWKYVCHAMPETRLTAVLFYQTEETGADVDDGCLLITGFLALIAAAMITWHIEMRRMVRNQVLTRQQYSRYLPSRIRRATLVFCLVCVAAVFALAGYYIRIASLRKETGVASRALEAVETRFEDSQKRNEALKNYQTALRLSMAKNAAKQMGSHPSLQTKEFLQKIGQTAGCEYVILYDTDGTELLSDKDYSGFSMGAGKDDEMAPFRRLLQGVDNWIAEPAEDGITGKTLQKIGVRVDTDEPGRYKAMVLAMDPVILAQEELQHSPDEMLETITPAETVCFSVDRETGDITHASEAEMRGAVGSSYGITDALLREHSSCGLSFNGSTWYGASRVMDGKVWYYCVRESVLQSGNLPFALKTAAVAAAYLGLLALLLLWKYTRKEYDDYSAIGREEVRDHEAEVVTADGRVKRSVDPAWRWGVYNYHWKEMTPGQKAKLVFQMGTLLLTGVLLLIVFRVQRADRGLLGFVLSGQWERGMNLFAISAVLMIIGSAFVLITLLRIIAQTIALALSAKGETVIRLLLSLIQYVTLLTVLFYGFRCFGIDTSALLGAMAFFSLAVSIGAKDIVADMLAGITIVFEGAFQVGDIVDIGGYKGKVMEIGARTTKLMGMGDNVKIINNRDVKNVLNMTRYNSWYVMQLNIAATYPLTNMEEILQRELPEIGKRTERLISGPVYKGVEEIGKGYFRVTILAECQEDDYRWVQRQLNREIRLMLDREQIPMA